MSARRAETATTDQVAQRVKTTQPCHAFSVSLSMFESIEVIIPLEKTGTADAIPRQNNDLLAETQQ